MAIDPIFRALQVPDRFESIRGKDNSVLGMFISPVKESLTALNQLFENAKISHRGQLFIVESRPGIGKTTFLNTASLFVGDMSVKTVASDVPPSEILGDLPDNDTDGRKLIVLEGRESIDHVSDIDLGQLLHQLNQRLRQPNCGNVVVAWPCNSSKLAERVVKQADAIGGSALIDPEIGRHIFKGPERKEFRHIASSTVGTLNDGADLVDLGIDEFSFTEMLNKCTSIGDLFSRISREVAKKRSHLIALKNVERHRVWIVAAAGSQPEKEIGGLTRGGNGSCDIQRLCNSTQANIVAEVKEYPDKLGLLSGYFDARITFLPVVTLLATVRSFADDAFRQKLASASIRVDIADTNDAVQRLNESQLATLLRGEQIGLLTSGQPVGTDSRKAFENLSLLASQNDRPLNKAIAEGLKAAGLIDDFELEQDFGSGLTRRTDIVAVRGSETIRLEMMWRKTTSKADMANYTLTKLYNYGRAIGYLSRNNS